MKGFAAIVLVVFAPNLVCAQEAPAGWPSLDPRKTKSATVTVRDDTGVEASGKLLRLDPDVIVLMVDDVERRFEADRVTRIEKRGDSLRNGVIIGALVGAAVGALAAGMADCPGSGGGECAGFRTGAFLGATGIYAAIGAGIDKMRVGRTTLYEAPAQTQDAAGSLRGRQFGINLAVRW